MNEWIALPQLCNLDLLMECFSSLNLPQQLVGLVDHLGGGQVVVGEVGVLAGSALDAAQLL